MDLAKCNEIMLGLMRGLPEQVTDSLEDVEVIVAESPAEGTATLLADARETAQEEGKPLTPEEVQELTLPADCKGVFIGDPMEKTDDADPDAEDSEVVYDPEGIIIFCASNIEDGDAAVLVFLHEVGHALGLGEDEVRELGLAVQSAKKDVTQHATEHATGG